MRPTLLVVVALLLVPVAFVRASPHGQCGEPGSPGIIKIGNAPATFYVDERGANQGAWIYMESNGISGLQRGGHGLVPTDVETCTDDSARGPDTLIL